LLQNNTGHSERDVFHSIPASKTNEYTPTDEKETDLLLDEAVVKQEQDRKSLLEEYERSMMLLQDANQKFEQHAAYLSKLKEQKDRLEVALHESATTATSLSMSTLTREDSASVPSILESSNLEQSSLPNTMINVNELQRNCIGWY
jgi:hypothetical protein